VDYGRVSYVRRTRFLVGCGGGSSTVRKLAGIGFPGTEPTSLLRQGDVRLTLDSANQRLPFGVVPLGDWIFRVITREPYPPGFDRDTPMTLEELAARVRRAFGVDLPMREPRWLSRFSDASRQADRRKSAVYHRPSMAAFRARRSLTWTSTMRRFSASSPSMVSSTRAYLRSGFVTPPWKVR
jgi:2-polyprenyl-6-methoxyphenol hydroxylase-like FAD-dependent oxidoreductase